MSIYKSVNPLDQTLCILYKEEKSYIKYTDESIVKIKDKCHARAIRRKTKFKDIIPGDVFYKKLFWKHEAPFGMVAPSKRTGMALVRYGEIIWYSMEGAPEGVAKREIIIEKINTKHFLISGLIPPDKINYIY